MTEAERLTIEYRHARQRYLSATSEERSASNHGYVGRPSEKVIARLLMDWITTARALADEIAGPA